MSVKTSVLAIEKEFDNLFAEIEKKYGYRLSFGSGSFDEEGNFSLKLKGQKLGAKTPEAQRYERNCGWMQLPPLDSTVKIGSKNYQIIGLNTRSTKAIGLYNGGRFLIPLKDVVLFYKAQNK